MMEYYVISQFFASWIRLNLNRYSSSECSLFSQCKCSMKLNLSFSNLRHFKLCVAVQHYRENAVSIHQASIHYQVPYTTLRRYCKNILPIKKRKEEERDCFQMMRRGCSYVLLFTFHIWAHQNNARTQREAAR